MRYINKSTNTIAGNAIIDRLLSANWSIDDSCYRNIYYTDGLLDKEALRTVLLLNQSNYCCYCMKLLSDDSKTTLEHIIPQNSTSDEYLSYTIYPELNDNVVHKDSFDRTSPIIPPPKYPHDIAYYNLVASCDSNAHCNIYRGSKFIPPLFYNQNIEQLIEYDEQGRINNEEFDDYLGTLGLSTNNDLRLYRKIWQKLSISLATPNDINDDTLESLLLNLIDDESLDKIINNLFGRPSKVDDLKRYQWFFYYYKR